MKTAILFCLVLSNLHPGKAENDAIASLRAELQELREEIRILKVWFGCGIVYRISVYFIEVC